MLLLVVQKIEANVLLYGVAGHSSTVDAPLNKQVLPKQSNFRGVNSAAVFVCLNIKFTCPNIMKKQ